MDALTGLSFSEHFVEELAAGLSTQHTYMLFAAGHMYSLICSLSLTNPMLMPFRDNLHNLAQVCGHSTLYTLAGSGRSL